MTHDEDLNKLLCVVATSLMQESSDPKEWSNWITSLFEELRTKTTPEDFLEFLDGVAYYIPMDAASAYDNW